jgi:hypothetical protein
VFAPPRDLDYTEQEQKDIAAMVCSRYEDQIQARTEWNDNHEVYDQMFRGRLPSRQGPWSGSADLHVQAPYWLVDALNVRLMLGIWAQIPLVSGKAEEDDDIVKASKNARLIEWHLSEKRMDARGPWARASKVRLTHGTSAALLSYVADTASYRTATHEGDEMVSNPDGTPQLDEGGEPIFAPRLSEEDQEQVIYQGPVLHPLDWDDTVVPVGCMNLQPNRPSNPGGADTVIVRQWEYLSLMMKKARGVVPVYGNMLEDSEREDREWWVAAAPSQDRSGTGRGSSNTNRERQEDRAEGMNRATAESSRTTDRHNPQFENLVYMGPWEDSDGNEQEMIFFVCRQPKLFLGGVFLSDAYYMGERPLLEWHYQTVGTRYYSMGVCEIVKYLSAELDTIHNMRLDVGFATNMPWFFYRAASGFDPDEITLQPLKGVPVDDPNDFAFPQMQNVTSFYHQEEQLLFTLIERVLGVTDLFLGVSPTSGASARHATGFVGAQQEAEARISEVLSQDARTFSKMCRMIYHMEMQYGPEERRMRLEGEGYDHPLTMDLDKEDLRMEGDYDFSLGANQGSFSQNQKQQQAQGVLQLAAGSPLMNQSPDRRWEAEAMYLRSIGIRDPERFIGPKEALPMTAPKSPSEEAGQMDQYAFGQGQPAPTHPSDDDQAHMRYHLEHLNSEVYRNMGSPNQEGHLAHLNAHQQQAQAKIQQAQQQASMASQTGTPTNGQQQQADPMNRAGAQVQNMVNAPSPGGDTALNQPTQLPGLPPTGPG